ncbi:hypothetical protein IscW_ISCW010740 [Ixodes scapularis]|uniref:Uncharacterized protein n=1 Tax=Ixodes scapularis TaxID=6945 RepID=B7Q841_IXOSC|nr:hypothetical protein IscW_ISCW010740 [Ixodes scapularis]|eukprot:XP_002404678.1 hypothetical protein IscW_ISCW010740 [Ixodes scapularis]
MLFVHFAACWVNKSFRVCYANDTFLLSEDARAEMRRMSKENRDATEALELEISDLVRQLKLTPTGARKDELAAQLKERQQRLKTYPHH